MLIKNDFEVAQPIDKVWTFFDDIPAVAACLPGAELTEDLGDDKYRGKVAIRMGPVKLQFAGNVAITERDNAGKRIVVDAAGADEKGRGQAAMLVTAKLMSIAGGTKIHVEQDLQLSGAAAQYGRGMISDVSSVLMRDFADNMQKRITARDTGAAVDTSTAAPAGGFAIGVRAAWMTLCRVARRFFMPYQPTPS
ncbi:MAG TPA: SRPBCC family protein [Ilumatobacteraceae bacterium]